MPRPSRRYQTEHPPPPAFSYVPSWAIERLRDAASAAGGAHEQRRVAVCQRGVQVLRPTA